MKNFIQEQMSKLFGKSQEVAEKPPMIKTEVTGLLQRDDKFQSAYNAWKRASKVSPILQAITAQYENGLQEDSILSAEFYHTPGAQGFYVYNLNGGNSIDYQMLMDYFRDIVLTLNYRLYSSTFEQKVRLDKVKRLERHYLKPAVWSAEMPMEQLYGNILIEVDFVNDQADHLKLLATHYTGFDYKPVRDFDELVQHMLKLPVGK